MTRTLAAFTDLGTTADSIQWWEPGVLVGDGVSCWERVTSRFAVPDLEQFEEAR